MANTNRKKPVTLNRWLAQNGVSQNQFANQCGVTVNYMNDLLNGKSARIHIDLLDKIVEVTGLGTEEILKELLDVWQHNKELAS